MKGIMHCRSLCQEFRIGGNLHLHIMNQKILDKLFYLVIGPYRNCGLYNHQTILFNRFGDLSGYSGNIA